jgi:yecA family protein
MKYPPLEKLSPAEARKLSGFLRSKRAPEGTLTLNQLKGYLFCICTTPELLQPSFWLPPVFGCQDEIPEFSSEADLSNIESIMRLYNQVNTGVLEGNPRLPANCTLGNTISSNFKPGSVLHEWSWGFDFGLNLTASCWDDLPLDTLDLEEDVNAYWTLLSFFADEQRARAAKLDTPQAPPFNLTIEIVREQMPWLIKDYAQLGRTFYETIYLADQADYDLPEPGVGSGETLPLFDDDDDGTDSLADALIEAAYDADSPLEAVSLAKQALDMDPHSVEALLLLARWDAHNKTEQLNYLRKAVAAGESQLGPDYFEQNTGHFWGLLETRPYMQALADLATAYRDNKKPRSAIELLEKSLQLNPNDNQGIRYLLLTLYLEQQRYDQARALLHQYSDDQSAFTLFSQLLLDYVATGDCAETRKQRRDAKSYNKYVVQYLSGRKKLPKFMPDYYGLGDKNEAILYAADNRNLWRQVMGAIPWLLK